MKATGIVRRIDDLGRVVIPKEIRRTMRIREGDPLEIFTNNDGEVIFKKYSPLGELGEFAGVYAEVLGKVLTTPVLICDRDHVIACCRASQEGSAGTAGSSGSGGDHGVPSVLYPRKSPSPRRYMPWRAMTVRQRLSIPFWQPEMSAAL